MQDLKILRKKVHQITIFVSSNIRLIPKNQSRDSFVLYRALILHPEMSYEKFNEIEAQFLELGLTQCWEDYVETDYDKSSDAYSNLLKVFVAK